MILRGIHLENFGLYAGVNEFDLIPRRRKGGASPIVLIGGKNGAGKTTLLEAVRLALYGRRALGARVSQVEYDAYLRSHIHRAAKTKAATVALEFDYAEAGIIHRYRVRREWSERGKSVFENLTLDKDGVPITAVPREEWHLFLQELIPPGVSQLFFFDGEKIREIADGEEDNEQLAEAIRGLLGIELVGRLRTDLGLFLARHQREEDDAFADQLRTTIGQIASLNERASKLTEEIAELFAQREGQARAAEQIRRRFVAEGGDAAVNRTRMEGQREEIRLKLARAEHDLRELANKLLPFAVAPKLIARFRVALTQMAAAGGRNESVKEALAEALTGWRKKGEPSRKAEWTSKHWSDLTSFVRHWHRDTPGTSNLAALREVGDGTVALARLVEVENVARPRAIALGQELDALTQQARQIDTALARADNAAAGLLLDELRLAEQRVGTSDAKLKSEQDELKIVRGQLVTLERERRRLLDSQADAAINSDRAALAARAAHVLAAYEERLLSHKLGQLRGEFVRCFNHLARKEDLIADIRIHSVSFQATLIDRNGHEIPKSMLSAGEKQIYAIAMLWALARTSGRSLPMIIDTPLARLDSDHRANLIERYFPAASHQVILLSTDTEVDEKLLADLGKNVSHTYRLDYDSNEARTVPLVGYFDSARRTKETQHALQQA